MAKEKKEKEKKDINAIIDNLAKDYERTFFNGREAALEDVRIPLSSPTLTWLYGGFKLNCIHRLNGKESGGKTTLATLLAIDCQKYAFKRDGNYNRAHVCIIDYERTFDVLHAEDLGLLLEDPTNPSIPLVHVIRHTYMEECEKDWETIVESNQVCCTIFDSDSAGANHTEFDNDELGKACVGPDTEVEFELA